MQGKTIWQQAMSPSIIVKEGEVDSWPIGLQYLWTHGWLRFRKRSRAWNYSFKVRASCNSVSLNQQWKDGDLVQMGMIGEVYKLSWLTTSRLIPGLLFGSDNLPCFGKRNSMFGSLCSKLFLKQQIRNIFRGWKMVSVASAASRSTVHVWTGFLFGVPEFKSIVRLVWPWPWTDEIKRKTDLNSAIPKPIDTLT